MHHNGHHHEPLPPPGDAESEDYRNRVIAALGDSPETVIALQFLQQGTCEVLCVGDPADLEGIIIQSFEMPGEPIAYGSSAEAIAELLPHLVGWTCINVPTALVDDLLEPVAAAAGTTSIRLLDDVYHELRLPPRGSIQGNLRLLSADDRDLVAADRSGLVGDGVDRLLHTLDNGHVAAAVDGDSLVALSYTFATSEKHADIGVVTHPDWRGRGLATAATALVAGAIQADGRIPVWSCGSTNLASLRVAARVGFVEVSRRTYIIPELDDPGDET